jgi:hypothetical protein
MLDIRASTGSIVAGAKGLEARTGHIFIRATSHLLDECVVMQVARTK